MFSITLICMGKLKEKFYIQASEEYKKRLGAFCDFQLLELPEGMGVACLMPLGYPAEEPGAPKRKEVAELLTIK